MQTVDFIELAIKKQGINARQLSLRLGVDPGRISNYRRGRARMDDEMAVQIAKLAGLDVAGVLAAVHADRSRDPEAKAALLDVARERLGGLLRVALCGVMIGGGFTASPTVQASPESVRDLTHAIHYAQRRRRRRVLCPGRARPGNPVLH